MEWVQQERKLHPLWKNSDRHRCRSLNSPLLAKREISPPELANDVLNRIEELNPRLIVADSDLHKGDGRVIGLILIILVAVC
jgi:hypothetical protein